MYACPKCAHREITLWTMQSVTLTIESDADPAGYTETVDEEQGECDYADDDTAMCTACNFQGELQDFEKGYDTHYRKEEH